MRIAERPIIYEINTAVFLTELSEKYKKTITLGNVPTAEWDYLKSLPIDAVWLMGVWQRSLIGRQRALEKISDFKNALPDLEPNDIIGSPYCVYEYRVDERFGGPKGLAAIRRQLASIGIGLILDFVPNHSGLDSPLTKTNPEAFVRGTQEEAQNQPKHFYKISSGVVAYGKDPNYDPWTDVAQLNAFSEGCRQVAIKTLKTISQQCDGVRCDMAMLMCSEIFASTWGERAGTIPDTEYWPEIIDAVRADDPDFVFMAEVYWDMQETLLSQGFNFCYDKDFYDIIKHGSASKLHRHLESTEPIQKSLVRFLENHDEDRVASSLLEPKKQIAAAVILTFLEGARLYYDGQLEGYKVRVPVQLNRGPTEKPNKELHNFYQELFTVFSKINLQDSQWHLLKCTSYFGLPAHNVVAWSWQQGAKVYLVVVNYSHKTVSAKIPLSHNLKSAKELLASGFSRSRTSRLGPNQQRISLNEWGYAVLDIS